MKHLLTATALGLCLAGAAQAQTVLTVANWLPPSHPLVSELIVPMTEQIAEATGGEVTATILPAPLGPPQAHFDFAVNGVADITFGVQGYNPGRFKTTNIVELPFLGDSAEDISVAYWRVFDQMLRDAGEYDDVHVLSVFSHGPGEVFLKSGDVFSDESNEDDESCRGGLVAGGARVPEPQPRDAVAVHVLGRPLQLGENVHI